MNSYIRPSGYNLLPPVTKNLLILNGLGFLVTIVLGQYLNFDVNREFGLFYIGSELFKPIQIITHLFLHANLEHLLYNMFAFWMFGTAIENMWGPKRFLVYYFLTGLGAAVLHQFVDFLTLQNALKIIPEGVLQQYIHGESVMVSPDVKKALDVAASVKLGNVIGASGSVFGILLAFGMLFPNALIYLFFAIPIKAKWLVMGYGGFEIFRIIQNNPTDNIAHFAHLGGMLFGFILIMIWKKKDIQQTRWQ